MADVSISVMWFRRDLRLADHSALRAAVGSGPDGVVPHFVLDPTPVDRSSRVQLSYLGASLASLSERVNGLHVVQGHPADEVVRVARRAGARTAHISADHEPDRPLRGGTAPATSAPYFRVFNPATQRQEVRSGRYVRAALGA